MSITRSQAALLSEAAAEAVAGDRHLRHRVQKIMGALLDDVEHLIRYGAEKDRVALTKAMMPALMKSLGAAEEDDRARRQQAAYDEMMAQLRGDWGDDEGDDESGGSLGEDDDQ